LRKRRGSGNQRGIYLRRRIALGVVVLALLGFVAWVIWPEATSSSTTQDSSKTSAKSSPEKPSKKPRVERPKIIEPPPSDLAYPGFYPPYYEIEAKYTESPRTISGTEKLQYVNAEDRPMTELKFQVWTNEDVFTERGGGTQVRNATVDGEKARLKLKGTAFTLELPEPMPVGDTADISFEFETSIPEIEAPFGHYQGVSSLGVWYPMLAVYDEDGWNISPPTDFGEPYFAGASNYKVSLTLPKDLSPAATGIETESERVGEFRTFTYEAEAVRDFALAIGDNFAVESRKVGDTTVNVHYRPESAFRATRTAELAAASLQTFSEIYGPYPYKELEIVDAPLITGTEYSGLTFVSIANSEDYIFDTVVPHEVAHQWWYVKVGSDQFESPWLDESLATYSEWLFTGDADTRFPTLLEPYAPLDSPVDAFPDTGTYQNTIYVYGAQLYRDLAYEIGQETLFAGLRTYANQNDHKITTAEDLVQTLSEAAGEDLWPFFEARGITRDTSDKEKSPDQ